MSEEKATGQKALFLWAQRTAAQMGVLVTNFTDSWRDGKAYLALFAYHRPEMLPWETVANLSDDSKAACLERLETAFKTSARLGVEPMIDAPDLLAYQDSKCNIIYLTQIFKYFKENRGIPRAVNPLSAEALAAAAPPPSSDTAPAWKRAAKATVGAEKKSLAPPTKASDLCAGCATKMYPRDQKVSLPTGATYHKTCFFCSRCQKSLTPTTAKVGDTALFCERHYRDWAERAPASVVAAATAAATATPATATATAVTAVTAATPTPTAAASEPAVPAALPVSAPPTAASAPATGPVNCIVCGARFGPRDVRVELPSGTELHNSCFACAVCRTTLTRITYHELGGKLLCARHCREATEAEAAAAAALVAAAAAVTAPVHAEVLGDACDACGKRLQANELQVEVPSGHSYHRACFCCTKCQIPLTRSSFTGALLCFTHLREAEDAAAAAVAASPAAVAAAAEAEARKQELARARLAEAEAAAAQARAKREEEAAAAAKAAADAKAAAKAAADAKAAEAAAAAAAVKAKAEAEAKAAADAAVAAAVAAAAVRAAAVDRNAPPPAGVCHLCRQPVSGGQTKIKGAGMLLHKEGCFACGSCKKALSKASAMVVQTPTLALFCRRHAPPEAAEFAPSEAAVASAEAAATAAQPEVAVSNDCARCRKAIAATVKAVMYKKRRFHKKCFSCEDCGTKLKKAGAKQVKGRVLCAGEHGASAAGGDAAAAASSAGPVSCARCSQVIGGEDKSVLFKKGRYHRKCFVCWCGVKLKKPDVAVSSDKLPCCLGHELGRRHDAAAVPVPASAAVPVPVSAAVPTPAPAAVAAVAAPAATPTESRPALEVVSAEKPSPAAAEAPTATRKWRQSGSTQELSAVERLKQQREEARRKQEATESAAAAAAAAAPAESSAAVAAGPVVYVGGSEPVPDAAKPEPVADSPAQSPGTPETGTRKWRQASAPGELSPYERMKQQREEIRRKQAAAAAATAAPPAAASAPTGNAPVVAVPGAESGSGSGGGSDNADADSGNGGSDGSGSGSMVKVSVGESDAADSPRPSFLANAGATPPPRSSSSDPTSTGGGKWGSPAFRQIQERREALQRARASAAEEAAAADAAAAKRTAANALRTEPRRVVSFSVDVPAVFSYEAAVYSDGEGEGEDGGDEDEMSGGSQEPAGNDEQAEAEVEAETKWKSGRDTLQRKRSPEAPITRKWMGGTDTLQRKRKVAAPAAGQPETRAAAGADGSSERSSESSAGVDLRGETAAEPAVEPAAEPPAAEQSSAAGSESPTPTLRKWRQASAPGELSPMERMKQQREEIRRKQAAAAAATAAATAAS